MLRRISVISSEDYCPKIASEAAQALEAQRHSLAQQAVTELMRGGHSLSGSSLPSFEVNFNIIIVMLMVNPMIFQHSQTELRQIGTIKCRRRTVKEST